MESQRVFYAKSRMSNGHQPTVKEHLERVSELASVYGNEIGCEKEARLAGKLHDFGKYSDAFQAKLESISRDGPGVNHEICGAALLWNSLGKLRDTKRGKAYRPVIEVINGHHGGLCDYGELEQVLDENIKSEEPVERNGRRSALSGIKQYRAASKAFKNDFPDFKIPILRTDSEGSGGCAEVSEMLFSRMLFSCLVDADYSISASDKNEGYLNETERIPFDAGAILKSLYSYRDSIKKNSTAEQALNKIRDYVFDQCGEKGEECREGLFTLTAPTGVGKTLALLHFALRHCLSTKKSRIIIVLPFLTLTEQNADTYRKIFPWVLEDHSRKDLNDLEREYASRWSAPFIITTSVRFFESLFSNRPTDCRKLHHIANSVVVFDEAQSLPADVTLCTLQAVNELCRKYHCTMVFSTATQPDFGAIRTVEWKPNEILPENAALYQKLRRTKVEWRIKKAEPLSDIASEIVDYSSVCVIVNLRRHARELFLSLRALSDPEEVFFLSTDLCADHRTEIIKRIRKRLAAGLPCRVVATQCIEAGVDLDFSVMYRSLAPLDSIIQAAGRWNRNGKSSGLGRVVVFVPEDIGRLYPGTWYEHASQKVAFLLHHHPLDIHNPTHIQEYYQLVYGEAADRKELVDAIRKKKYDMTDQEYKLIKDEGYRVIVPYKGKTEEFDRIREEALEKGISPFLIRKCAGITVSVSRVLKQQLEVIGEQIPYSPRGRLSECESRFYIIRQEYSDIYLDDMGLQIPDSDNIELDPFW